MSRKNGLEILTGPGIKHRLLAHCGHWAINLPVGYSCTPFIAEFPSVYNHKHINIYMSMFITGSYIIII